MILGEGEVKMHEWALAEAVLQSVEDELADRGPISVRSVTLLFGELQKIDREVFLIGLRSLCRDTSLNPDVFQVEEEPASFRCSGCGREWGLDETGATEEEREAIHFLPESAHAYMRCPGCGSPDFRVEKGRGVVIQAIEFVEGEER